MKRLATSGDHHHRQRTQREDMDRLDGQIDGLLQKGSFMDDDLLAEMTESLAS